MGIPVKGSRKLDFQGSTYRYMIRKDKPRRQSGFISSSRVVTVQKVGDGDKPVGQVLQVKLYARAWYETGDEMFCDEETLTPMDVKQVIGVSLILGWNPKGKGTFTPSKGIDLPAWEQ